MVGSLQVRLTILCIALAIIPLSGIGVLLAWQNYQLQQRYVLDSERQLAQGASLQVGDFVANEVAKLALAIQTSDLRNSTQAAPDLLLSQVILATNGFDELGLVDPTGREHVRVGRKSIFTAKDLRDRSQETIIIAALRDNQPYYSAIHFSETTNEPVIEVALPVQDLRSGLISWVVSGEVRLKSIGDVVANIKFGDQGTISIVDSTKRVIAHRNPSVVLRGTTIADLQAEGIVPGITDGDVVRTINTFTVGNQLLYTLADLPFDEAHAAAYQTILTTSLLLLATLIIAAGIGFVAIRRVARPIQNLAATARAISAGDLSRNATVTGRDELADMSGAFNTMTARLRNVLGDLEQQVADRTAALGSALHEVQARAHEQELLLAENARQRETILGLSVPVLPVSRNTLVMPLVGDLDSGRLLQVQEQALQALERSAARYLVIDITGVPLVDSHVAQGLLAVVQSARLLGVSVVLVGIRPEVAQAIVSLGIDLRGLRTASDLQTAMVSITA